MFAQANRFASAANILASGPVELASQMVFPSLFNGYVACELYLKLLNYRHSGQQISGHNLHFLFQNLPAHHRAKTRKAWKNRKITAAERNPPIPIPETLEGVLQAAAFGYEDFRYLWESEFSGVFLIGDFHHILYNVVIELYPDLVGN